MDYGAAFLKRVSEETERVWKDPYLGLGWQPGTRWRGGLTDDEVAHAEHRFGLRFPPDYRLFLQTLHTTDPERVRYLDGYEPGIPFWQDVVDWPGD